LEYSLSSEYVLDITAALDDLGPKGEAIKGFGRTRIFNGSYELVTIHRSLNPDI
jgi:hypothetical protein